MADREVVNRYLKAAAEKLADLAGGTGQDERARGADVDDLAGRSGLASGLVRQQDIDEEQDRRRRARRRGR